MKVPVKRKPKNLPKPNVKVRGGKFTPGHPKYGGRKKGTPNKFTTLKQAFLDVFLDIGGSEGMATWARSSRSNRAFFYNLLAKMLPKDVVLQSPGDSPNQLPFILRVEK